jgi:hypothetical protein
MNVFGANLERTKPTVVDIALDLWLKATSGVSRVFYCLTVSTLGSLSRGLLIVYVEGYPDHAFNQSTKILYIRE